MGPPEIVIAETEDFAARAADEITARLRAVLAERGTAFLALAGGSTPRPVYRALAATMGGLRQAEWNRVHFFWSDERWVPVGDSRTNAAAATDDLLSTLNLPPENIHMPRLEEDPAASAAAYGREIRLALNVEAGATPRFDLVLLGVGSDGHTASLFPDSAPEPAAAPVSAPDLVVATYSPAAPHERISFSFELLGGARVILILVSGESKAEVVRRVLKDNDRSLPVSRVELRSGSLCWLLDKAASSRLAED